MPGQAAAQNGKYLYAIVACADDPGAVQAGRDYGPIGIDGGTVYTLSGGRAAAVVSCVPNEKVRPQRRHLAAHQEVLKRLMEETTPLPMAFGVIADGPDAIQGILSHNRDAFFEQLQRVAGKVEMGLRITWDVPNIFEYFVDTHPELRVTRDRFFGIHRNPSQEEKIELGRMFDRTLDEDREAHAEKVEGVLSRHCAEIKRNRCRNEREVMNLACLVGREGQAEFEAGIFEAAEIFDNTFVFDYNGPWPPHNFVDINLRT